MRMIPIFIYFYFYLFLLEFSSSLDTTINSYEYKQYLIYRRSISTFDPFTLFPGATHCEKGDPDRFIWYCAPNLLRSLAEVDGKPNIEKHHIGIVLRLLPVNILSHKYLKIFQSLSLRTVVTDLNFLTNLPQSTGQCCRHQSLLNIMKIMPLRELVLFNLYISG